MKYDLKQIADINKRIEADEEVSEDECLLAMSCMFNIHPEHLEARFNQITNNDLLECPFDLPCGDLEDEEDDEDEWE